MTAEGTGAEGISGEGISTEVRGAVDMGPGAQSAAYTRVMPNDAGAELVFTQFQGADVPDDVFDQLVAAVGHELTTLKAILEVECPL